MAEKSTFDIMSYNCRGFDECKRTYINSLLQSSKTAILFLQEHWLSDHQLQSLAKIHRNYLYTGVSRFNNSDVLAGRPYGGTAILWRADMAASFVVLATDSKRACAIRMCSKDLKFLFINVYMPYEHSDETTSDFAYQLSVIENLMDTNG